MPAALPLPIGRVEACAGNADWSFDHPASCPALRSGWAASVYPRAGAGLQRALDLFDAEGGSRHAWRYTANMRTFYDGVRSLGLTPCLPPQVQGPIIVNVNAPADPAWDLQRFVDALKAAC